jgi:ATPase subunit of ABC transporter with duplicated ATPase domains
MSILNVENVTHGFGSRKILENASFRLLKGEHVGLIGANGEGKSTFLKIITGEMQADEGNVSWCNRITTGYLNQTTTLTPGKTIREVLREAFAHMYELEEELQTQYERMGHCTEEELVKIMDDVSDMQTMIDHSGFYSLDTRIEEYANGLGLGEIGLDRDVSELSGGQRTKVLLTKLLLASPMILILDEPTNFLDENHINWLKNYLINYEDAFILVSHDIPFLNAVTNVIYHVEDSELTRYKGDYNFFLENHALRKKQNDQAYERQQKEIGQLEVFIAKNRARAATATLARSRQKKLEKMDIIEKTKTKTKPVFEFKSMRTTGKVVIKADAIVLGYDEALTRPMDLVVERGQKIAITGVNGLGKTTLLKSLLGYIPLISGEIEQDFFVESGYFEQEHISEKHTALDEIWDQYPGMTNGEVRSALAKCGITAAHMDTPMKVLSGGENAKVRLCKLLLKPCNVLMLDEPTNHLDVDAKSALKKAVKNFKGTVLLVSHEYEFYHDIVSDVWDLSQYTTKIV